MHPAFVAGSQTAQRPARGPLVAQTLPVAFAAHRELACCTALQPTQELAWQSGAAAFVQSASVRHSPHVPPTQKRADPVPEHGAFEPQRQARFAQAFARSGSHADEQAAHRATLVGTHAAFDELSQQS